MSVVLLLVLAPVMMLCALVVYLRDGAPILFRQQRVGRHGRSFWIVKFRTMRPGAGGHVTAAGDPRVTGVGRVLRRTKLDELPQLWNVLVGHMSLVGPRPELPEYVALNERAYRAIWNLRPGVTDWASLIFRDEEKLLQGHAAELHFYEQDLLPRKLAIARLYSRRRSLLVDLCLVLATACTAIGVTTAVHQLIGKGFIERARQFR